MNMMYRIQRKEPLVKFSKTNLNEKDETSQIIRTRIWTRTNHRIQQKNHEKTKILPQNFTNNFSTTFQCKFLTSTSVKSLLKSNF